ncbi:MAG: CPBP family intramembrane metalloprotease [Roseivirga sp.]|nr:CPBP family intramembrane metalloprotease [Roseivirga sp.]
MEKHLKKDILTFLALVTVLSAIPYILIYVDGDTDSNWVMLLMWIPALSGIAARLIRKKSPFKGIGWNPLKSFKWMLVAMVIPLIVTVVYLSLLFGLGLAEFDPGYIIRDGNKVMLARMGMIFGGGAPQNVFLYAGNFLLSFFVGNLLYVVTFALGEEYGWRGYLQPLLTEGFGVKKGLFFVGLIWGYWHLPGILMGHNFPDYPVFGGLILMPLGCIGMSYAFGSVYNKSGIIWMPAMFHSAFNMVSDIHGGAIMEGTRNALGSDIIYVCLWVLAGWLCFRFLKPAGADKGNEEEYELPH